MANEPLKSLYREMEADEAEMARYRAGLAERLAPRRRARFRLPVAVGAVAAAFVLWLHPPFQRPLPQRELAELHALVAAGSPDIVEAAFEKSMDILNNYKPDPRPEAVQKELDRIYAEYEEIVRERKAKEAEKK